MFSGNILQVGIIGYKQAEFALDIGFIFKVYVDLVVVIELASIHKKQLLTGSLLIYFVLFCAWDFVSTSRVIMSRQYNFLLHIK